MADVEDHWNEFQDTRERAILWVYEIRCLVSRFVGGAFGIIGSVMAIVGSALKSSGDSTFASTALLVIGASVVFAAVVVTQIVEIIIEKNVKSKLQEGYDVDRHDERDHSPSLQRNPFIHLCRLAIFGLSIVLIVKATNHSIIQVAFTKLGLYGENILIASLIIALHLLQLITSCYRAIKLETIKDITTVCDTL